MRLMASLALMVGVLLSGGQPAARPVPVAAQPAGGTWLNLAPMNRPRSEVGVAELDGKIYVLGGFLYGRLPTDAMEVYDPATDAWDDLAPVPRVMTHITPVGFNGRLYVFGGSLGTNLAATIDNAWVYDPAPNTWAEIAAMPKPRSSMGVAVIGDRIYLGGGLQVDREHDFTVYDPAANRYETLPEVPTRRNHLAAVSIGQLFYAAGGRTGPGVPNVVNTDALEVYDSVAGTWTALAPMLTPRGSVAAAAVNGCIYVFNGELNPNSPVGVFDQNERYDPRTNTWQAMPRVPLPVHGTGAVAIGSRIYLPGGGSAQGGGSAAPVHQAFDPQASCN